MTFEEKTKELYLLIKSEFNDICFEQWKIKKEEDSTSFVCKPIVYDLRYNEMSLKFIINIDKKFMKNKNDDFNVLKCFLYKNNELYKQYTFEEPDFYKCFHILSCDDKHFVKHGMNHNLKSNEKFFSFDDLLLK